MGKSLNKPAKNRNPILLTLYGLIFLGVIYWLTIFILPIKNTSKHSLQGKLYIPSVIKNVPTPRACTEPRYTYIIADCGAGVCPDEYKINYATRTTENELSKTLDAYIKSLNAPYEYFIFNEQHLHSNPDYKKIKKAARDETCSEIMININPLDY